MVNQGVEGSITYRDEWKGLKFTATGNVLYSENKIEKWISVEGEPEWQSVIGHPVPQYYWWPDWELMYQADGIYQNQAEINAGPVVTLGKAKPGDIRFKDVDGNDTINVRDRVRGYTNDFPKLVYGMTFKFEYKMFDLTTTFQGAGGSKRYLGFNGTNMPQEWFDNRWSPENADLGTATWPRVPAASYWYGDRMSRNTFFAFNNNYLRLKVLEIGFNTPKKWTNALKIQDLRIYFSGTNLLTFSKYKIQDPESDDVWATNTSYPVLKVYNVGINLSF
jgi:hypothetical protein